MNDAFPQWHFVSLVLNNVGEVCFFHSPPVDCAEVDARNIPNTTTVRATVTPIFLCKGNNVLDTLEQDLASAEVHPVQRSSHLLYDVGKQWGDFVQVQVRPFFAAHPHYLKVYTRFRKRFRLAPSTKCSCRQWHNIITLRAITIAALCLYLIAI